MSDAEIRTGLPSDTDRVRSDAPPEPIVDASEPMPALDSGSGSRPPLLDGGRAEVAGDGFRERVLVLAKQRLEGRADLPKEPYLHAVSELLEESAASLEPIWHDNVRRENLDRLLQQERSRYRSVRRRGKVATAIASVVIAMVLFVVAANIPWLDGTSLLVALLATPFSVVLARRPAARRLREQQGRVEEVQQRLRSLGTGSLDDFDALIEATVLAPAETRALTVLWSAADDEIVVMEDGPLLSSKAETGNILETAASRRLAVALQRRLGSAVGIAGSRGSGKTELVRRFTGPSAKSEAAADSTVGVFLWAPVYYAPNMFLIRLLKEVCLAVLRGSDADTTGSRIGNRRFRHRHLLLTLAPGLSLTAAGIGLIVGNRWNIDLREDTFALGIVLIVAGGVLLLLLYVLPGMAFPLRLRYRRYARVRWDDGPAITHARALLQRAEFVETNSMGLEVGASIQPFSAKGTSGRQLQRVPLTDLDVVWELQGLVQELALQNRRTVIAIDELDKMRNDEEAIGFINHLKVLFPIRNCSFIVSVSESAWARFEHRGLPFRDAFDSALDEVIYLDLLTIAESRDLLRRRTGHITPLQALLCHCLAGGLPRDLLRAARHLAQAAGRADDRKLPTVLGVVLDEELEAKVKAAELRIRSHDPHNLHSDVLHELTSWRHRWRDPLSPESPRRHRSNETDVVIGDRAVVEGGGERTNSLPLSPQLPVDGESAMHVGNRDAEGATPSGTAEVKAVHAEVVSYVAFLLTVRDAFTPGGPADGLVQSSAGSPLLQGFEMLARARHRLSLDTVDACRMVARARVLLSLPKLDEDTLWSRVAPPGPRASAAVAPGDDTGSASAGAVVGGQGLDVGELH